MEEIEIHSASERKRRGSLSKTQGAGKVEEKLLHGIFGELKTIIKLSLPVALTNTFQFLVLVVSVIMCGRLSKLEMDAVSLGNSLINAVGISPGIGLCTACDTLFSQSFGSSNKKRTGMWLQKSFFVLNSITFVVIAFHLNVEPILIALGQDPIVSRMTGEYMAIFAPGLFLHWNYVILARYLQTQNQIYVPLIGGFIGLIFNVVTQYLLIIVYNYGYQVSAYCQAATFGVMLLIEIAYIFLTKFYKATWEGFKREAVVGWGEFFMLAIAGVGHVTLEVISWEVGTFVAGTLGTTELAVQSILFQTETILIMTGTGIGIAVNIRVGQLLGGNQPKIAKRSLLAALMFVSILSAIFATLLITCRDIWPMLFTTHVDVIEDTARIMPLMGLLIIVDCLHVVASGGLRGCGRQKIGAFLIFLGFYIMGGPIGISLALATDLRVVGLWIGVLIGLGVVVVPEFCILVRQDWTEQARNAKRRVQEFLLYQSKVDRTCEETQSLLVKKEHIGKRRTATEPRGCSMDFAKMKIENSIPHKTFVRLVTKRILTCFATISICVCGILITTFLPEELYWPSPTNSTIVDNVTSVIP